MQPPRPSTYSPLLRRLFVGGERQREFNETTRLWQHVASHQAAITAERMRIVCDIGDAVRRLPSPLTGPLTKAMYGLVASEEQLWDTPAPAFETMSMQEFVEYRNLLYAKQHFIANQERQLAAFAATLGNLLAGIANELPELEGPTPFTIPLIFALPEPRSTLRKVWETLAARYDENLFRQVSRTLFVNMCGVNGRDPDDPRSKKPVVFPDEGTVPVDQLANTYLAGTPLHEVFTAPVPLKLTHADRFNHWHVVAGSGAGKTTLIENLIRHDLASDDPPSIVLIDPHSDLVRKLVRSDLGIEDRLILIDPRDTTHPVALNPFAANQQRLTNYDEATREQVTAGVNQTLGYLWNGLTNLTLTGKQDVFFRYVTRLLLTLPTVKGRNATILDMLKLMSNPEEYRDAIDALPPIPREFFERDFMNKTFEGTKEQIRYRIQAIIENPTMARLFTSPESKIDLFTEMNRGAVILVDTAKDFLKEASGIFGRLIISLMLQAVLERAAIPERERKPVFIIVDEAASFFSSNIDDLLTEARKYKAGLLLAHQFMDQATSSLRSSLAANTGIKFASGISAQDASSVARDMRTSPEYILSQRPLQFAAFIRGVTLTAVSVPVPIVLNAPRLADEEYERLMEHNRNRVSLTAHSRAAAHGAPTAPEEPTRSPPKPDADISPEW